MKEDSFCFCPKCGSREIQTVTASSLTQGFARKWKCDDCGFELYNNIASAVGLLICDKENRFLFEVRKKEPRKGFLAFPGGFVDADETAEEAALRECREETGVVPEKIRYLCSFPNVYEFKGITYKTCDMFFTADFPENFHLVAEESEVSDFEWVKIESQADIEKTPFAFESAKKTLRFLLERKDD